MVHHHIAIMTRPAYDLGQKKKRNDNPTVRKIDSQFIEKIYRPLICTSEQRYWARRKSSVVYVWHFTLGFDDN